MDFTIIKDIDPSHRVFLVDYQGKEAVLKINLYSDELVPYNEAKYYNKYSFLPIIYKIFNYKGKKAMLMEKLYPFVYDENKVDKLFMEVDKFQDETGRYKLDLSSSNIMLRSNGDIVLFDLWESSVTESFYRGDNKKSNRESLEQVLLYYKYQDKLYQYLADVQNLTNGDTEYTPLDFNMWLYKKNYAKNQTFIGPMIVLRAYTLLNLYNYMKTYLTSIDETFKSINSKKKSKNKKDLDIVESYINIGTDYYNSLSKNVNAKNVLYSVIPDASLKENNYIDIILRDLKISEPNVKALFNSSNF